MLLVWVLNEYLNEVLSLPLFIKSTLFQLDSILEKKKPSRCFVCFNLTSRSPLICCQNSSKTQRYVSPFLFCQILNKFKNHKMYVIGIFKLSVLVLHWVGKSLRIENFLRSSSIFLHSKYKQPQNLKEKQDTHYRSTMKRN